MEFWMQLLTLTITPAAVLGATTYLLRELFARGLQKDIESFKSELSIEAYKHQKRFSLVHDRSADVMAGLYSRLVRAAGLLSGLVNFLQPGGQSLIEKKRGVADSLNDASSFFEENRILLDDALAEKIERLLRIMKEVYIDFDMSQSGNDEYKPDPHGYWKRSYDTAQSQLPGLLKELRDEFKHQLGLSELMPPK